MDLHLFSTLTYTERRSTLKSKIKDGLIVILGNEEAPMNYRDNVYRYRQDSSFLYYFGLNQPGLAAIIDANTGESTIYGEELTLDDIVWIGPHPLLNDQCSQVGVNTLASKSDLFQTINTAQAQGRTIHYLPPYRYDNIILLSDLFGKHHTQVLADVSVSLIKAVVDQRSIKSSDEIIQMEEAVNITREMHIKAMQTTRAGIYEQEVVGSILNQAKKHGSPLSYPAIFSINGQTLHNHYHGNLMQDGQLALNDSGAENKMGYAGDITRTMPVNGTFTTKQKEIYQIVLEMETSSIEMLKPDIQYKDIHIASNRLMLDRLKDLGITKGDMAEASALGVGGLFMPHGLGHMIGLDVHDMEDLGEQYVGYSPNLKRSTQLGLRSLRLAKKLQAGFVITVEPGIYFIPQLIQKWKSEGMHLDFINYDILEEYYDFGGIRIEDDVLITEQGHRILGDPIPKTIEEVEATMMS